MAEVKHPRSVRLQLKRLNSGPAMAHEAILSDAETGEALRNVKAVTIRVLPGEPVTALVEYFNPEADVEAQELSLERLEAAEAVCRRAMHFVKRYQMKPNVTNLGASPAYLAWRQVFLAVNEWRRSRGEDPFEITAELE